MTSVVLDPEDNGIHSKESASETLNGVNGEQWAVGFNVDAHARTSYGVATGSVTKRKPTRAQPLMGAYAHATRYAMDVAVQSSRTSRT
jgi:hypothetical protein